MRKTLLVLAALTVIVLTVGCVQGGAGSDPASKGATAPAGDDSVFVAYQAAEKSAQAVAPDVVMLMAGSPGVVLNPPPDSWDFLFGSEQEGRLYSVAVEHGKAGKAEDKGPFNAANVDLSKAVPVDSVKVGSTQAYEDAKAYVEKRDGSVPPNVMMSVSLIEIPGLQNQSVGDWSVTFIQGTSTEGMQRVQVDGATGEVSGVQ